MNVWNKGGFRFHGQNTENSPSMEILSDAVQICENLGLNYYIGAGTLLGLYRDKKLIPWDTDVDIEILFDTKDNESSIVVQHLIEQMRLYKFSLMKTAADNVFQQLCFTRENDFVVDFGFFYKEGDNYVNNHPDLGKISIRASDVGTPVLIEDFRAFENTEGYLEHRYGSEWKTPIQGDHHKWFVGAGVSKK